MKRPIQAKNQQLVETEPMPTFTMGEDTDVFADLSSTLAEIRKLKDVLGYILRSDTAAVLDLPSSETITEYAMLSAQVSSSGRKIADQFKLNEVECVLVEGKKLKLLCMVLGENKLSVFMEKSCAHAWIVKRILL